MNTPQLFLSRPCPARAPACSDRRPWRAALRCRSQQAASEPDLQPEVVPSALPRVLRVERDYGALDKKDFAKFVQFFRQASPYIAGHRGRTFVLAIPGEVGRATVHFVWCPRQPCRQLLQHLVHSASWYR